MALKNMRVQHTHIFVHRFHYLYMSIQSVKHPRVNLLRVKNIHFFFCGFENGNSIPNNNINTFKKNTHLMNLDVRPQRLLAVEDVIVDVRRNLEQW